MKKPSDEDAKKDETPSDPPEEDSTAKEDAPQDSDDDDSDDEADAGDDDSDKDDSDKDDADDDEADADGDDDVEAAASTKKESKSRRDPPRSRPSSRGDRAARARSASESRPSKSGPAESSSLTRGIALGVIALAIGAGGGWFLRDAKARGKAPFAPPAVASGEVSGPCKTWRERVCAETGDESAGCSQAKSAADVMPYAACAAAVEDVSGTLERVKLVRAVCDELVSRLCKDLGEESTACSIVKARSANIPPDGCRTMTSNYESVLAQLKMLDQNPSLHGGMRGGPPPGGMRPMPPPPGASGPGSVQPVPVPGGIRTLPPGALRVSPKMPQPMSSGNP
ncbi:MAG: hypothetical protein R3B13_35045 [Polyangiaceae bacterium]